MNSRTCTAVFWLAACFPLAAAEEQPKLDTGRGDRMIADYFRLETEKLRDACLADIETLDDWKNRRDEYRRQLLEMLGLDPLPEKTDLRPVITGRVKHDEFVVENLHFESRPGLYVTGNLFLPVNASGRHPAILYVCGHGGVKKGGISYGNKVHYQRHGEWFARNGYVCLTIDSLQLGEIEGIHHGTYQYGMWWWWNRGYTPAGVEAWNCVRALDYLQSRPEVDPDRIGVTGRSGGGIYSWWIAAIDDRIKAAAPVAGVTDLQNHVVDGCVEGHCDCMFCVNTYRWDYPLVAALVAPRPLLIGNTDSDSIFPLDGVMRTFEKVRKIYRLHGEADKVGVAITWGPHKDTQELQVPVLRWFNHHLQGNDRLIHTPAMNFLDMEQLRVFRELPKDQLNTEIQETFVPQAPPASVPDTPAMWNEMTAGWRRALDTKCFGAWPATAEPLRIAEAFRASEKGVSLRAWDFTSQGPVRLRLYLAGGQQNAKPERVTLKVLDETSWREFLAAFGCAFAKELHDESLPAADPAKWAEIEGQLRESETAVAYFAPRGIGPTAWDPGEKKQVQLQRRFYLIGQTLEAGRVWDVRRAIESLRSAELCGDAPVTVASRGRMAGVCLYAALYQSGVAALTLEALPATHREGPIFLNVQRYLEMPQALAMVMEHLPVTVVGAKAEDWVFAAKVREKLGWDQQRLQFAPSP